MNKENQESITLGTDNVEELMKKFVSLSTNDNINNE